MLRISGGKKLLVLLRDISLAYVSKDTNLLRKVYLIPSKELGLDPDTIRLVLKTPHGLPESGVPWFETYLTNHTNKLKMYSAEIDPCLLHRIDRQDLNWIVCLQVDESIGAGTPK
eukprot:IDg5881t1